MKKLLLTLSIACLATLNNTAQCVYTCSNYAVSSISHSVFPSGSTNLVSTFTNPVLGTWADDGDSGPLPIGFNFDFYCNTYTDIWICSNGFISFIPIVWPDQYVHPTQLLPDPTVPNAMVALNMVDLDPGAGGTITYTTVGTSPNRMCIITFSNVPCWNFSSDITTGQIVLYETSNIIEIHTTAAMYHQTQSPGSTQGIENANGSVAAVPPGRNANKVWNNNGAADFTAYRFAPYSAPAISPISGNTVLCEGTTGNYLIQNATGALGYSWTAPGSWVGTSSTTAITYTAGASGVLSVTAEYTCGASPASTIAVTVNQAPVVSLTSVTSAIVCSGKTVQINVSGAAIYTLEPGGFTGTGPFVDMPMAPTAYTVTGTDSLGCNSLNSSSKSVVVQVSPTISVNSGTICEGETFAFGATGADTYAYQSVFPQVSPAPGVYSYTITGTSLSNGCKSEIATSHLTVSAFPTTAVMADRPAVCAKESLTLTASGAASYTWSSSAATTSSISFVPASTGWHQVTGFSAEGCAKTASVFVIVNPCTGIAENEAADEFKVYPNPGTGMFKVESAVAQDLIIVDVTGRQVVKQKIAAGTNTVNLTELAPGHYILKCSSSGAQRSVVILGN